MADVEGQRPEAKPSAVVQPALTSPDVGEAFDAKLRELQAQAEPKRTPTTFAVVRLLELARAVVEIRAELQTIVPAGADLDDRTRAALRACGGLHVAAAALSDLAKEVA